MLDRLTLNYSKHDQGMYAIRKGKNLDCFFFYDRHVLIGVCIETFDYPDLTFREHLDSHII